MKTIIDGRKTSTSLYTLCALSVWMAGVKNSVANEIEGTNLLTSIDIAFVAVTVCMILFSAIMTCRYALGRYKNVAIVGYRPRWQLFIYDIIGVILGLTTLFGTENIQNAIALIIVPLIEIRLLLQAFYGFVPLKYNQH